jgi:hypothetical protein
MGDGMAGNRGKSRDWVRTSTFLGVLVALVEWMMVNELVFRWHSYFLASAHNKVQIYLYIFTMILIPCPWVISIGEIRNIEKKMRMLGADEEAIASRQKAMFDILFISYMVLMLCVEAMSGLLPQP